MVELINDQVKINKTYLKSPKIETDYRGLELTLVHCFPGGASGYKPIWRRHCAHEKEELDSPLTRLSSRRNTDFKRVRTENETQNEKKKIFKAIDKAANTKKILTK